VIFDKLIPAATGKLDAINDNYPAAQYIYIHKDADNVPDLAVIVSRYKNKNMENVIVLNFSKQEYSDAHQLSNIYHAKKGITLSDRWHLNDITHYKISNDGIFFDIDQLEEMDILEGQAAKNAYTLMTYAAKNINKRERGINNKDMRSYIKLLKEEGLDDEYRSMLNKYLQRYTHPLVCVLLAILGCLLGFGRPREQRMFGFMIAIGCIFVYYITMPFFDMLAEKGILAPVLTATLPLVMFACAIGMFYKSKEL